MAELILTDAEKRASSYLGWDDADLGRAVKKVALLMGEMRGNDSLTCTAGAVLLACEAARHGGVLTLHLDSIADGYGRVADWQLVVSRLTGKDTDHRVGDPDGGARRGGRSKSGR